MQGLDSRLIFASDDDEDETAELQRELEKIKRERAEKREQEVRTSFPARHMFSMSNWTLQERERAAAEEAEREHDIALGNPLLNPKADFNVKRRYSPMRTQPQTSFTNSDDRWDDDVIFKNQARGTDDKGKKKEFVNVSFLFKEDLLCR
jgi:protein CWC15